ETIPRAHELNDITRAIEEGSLDDVVGVDNDTQEMPTEDDITLNESEPDERARAEPAVTKPLGGQVTQFLDTSRLSAATTQPLETAPTVQLQDPATEPLGRGTTDGISTADTSKTVEFTSMPPVAAMGNSGNHAQVAAPVSAKRWWLAFGIAG